MRQRLVSLFCIGLAALALNSSPSQAQNKEMKEWTFLVYLNGHNSLDQFGPMNIKQMEKVGSTDQLNIVVQWASMSFDKTKRLLVTKSTNQNQVTSPIVEEPGLIDMGDYNSLVDFIKWGAEHYPAKHYMVDVWNHGGGWHDVTRIDASNGVIKPTDISWDDRTGHVITTEQLGLALGTAAKNIGHKIDVYASDACLMAMAEVGAEMKSSVSVMVGSEEVEPGAGWPYDDFLSTWVKAPRSSAAEVGKMLSHAYAAAYSGGQYGHQDITMSVVDLNKMDAISASMKAFVEEVKSLNPAMRAKVLSTAQASLSYTYDDYKDMTDFITRLEKSGVNLRATVLSNLRDAVKQSVLENDASGAYANSRGLAFWFPNDRETYQQYAQRYAGLQFNKDTNWNDVLSVLY